MSATTLKRKEPPAEAEETVSFRTCEEAERERKAQDKDEDEQDPKDELEEQIQMHSAIKIVQQDDFTVGVMNPFVEAVQDMHAKHTEWLDQDKKAAEAEKAQRRQYSFPIKYSAFAGALYPTTAPPLELPGYMTDSFYNLFWTCLAKIKPRHRELQFIRINDICWDKEHSEMEIRFEFRATQ